MAPRFPGAYLPARLDDRRAFVAVHRFLVPQGVAMEAISAAVRGWDVERDAIRSVVSDHATVELDTSRYTTLTVRIATSDAPDRSTIVHVAITLRASMMGLAVGLMLVNTVVGVPIALFLRRRDRVRALEIGRCLVSEVFSKLDDVVARASAPPSP